MRSYSIEQLNNEIKGLKNNTAITDNIKHTLETLDKTESNKIKIEQDATITNANSSISSNPNNNSTLLIGKIESNNTLSNHTAFIEMNNLLYKPHFNDNIDNTENRFIAERHLNTNNLFLYSNKNKDQNKFMNYLN